MSLRTISWHFKMMRHNQTSNAYTFMHTHTHIQEANINKTIHSLAEPENYFCCSEFQFCYQSNLPFIRKPEQANSSKNTASSTNSRSQ